MKRVYVGSYSGTKMYLEGSHADKETAMLLLKDLNPSLSFDEIKEML